MVNQSQLEHVKALAESFGFHAEILDQHEVLITMPHYHQGKLVQRATAIDGEMIDHAIVIDDIVLSELKLLVRGVQREFLTQIIV